MLGNWLLFSKLLSQSYHSQSLNQVQSASASPDGLQPLPDLAPTQGCLDTSLRENHQDKDLEPVSLPLSRNTSLKEISLLASCDFSIPASSYLSLFYSKCCTAALCALYFSGLHLGTAEKFHFVLPLHSTHQIPRRESASVTAHIGHQVKRITFKTQNRLWDKLRVLQKPSSSSWTAATNGMGCNL